MGPVGRVPVQRVPLPRLRDDLHAVLQHPDLQMLAHIWVRVSPHCIVGHVKATLTTARRKPRLKNVRDIFDRRIAAVRGALDDDPVMPRVMPMVWVTATRVETATTAAKVNVLARRAMAGGSVGRGLASGTAVRAAVIRRI